MPNLLHYLPDPYTLRSLLFAASFLGLLSLYVRIAQARLRRQQAPLTAETPVATTPAGE